MNLKGYPAITMAKPMIFGIGMNKTGGSSLKLALRALGFRCMQGARLLKRAMRENAGKAVSPLYPYDENHDAFVDSPINVNFKLLDAAYPGSRFILTIRDREAWLVSRVAQFGGTREEHEKKWQKHMVDVYQHFSNRQEDLLVYDLCGGEGWTPLCNFLKVSVPTEPIPWVNKTGAKRKNLARRRLGLQDG